MLDHLHVECRNTYDVLFRIISSCFLVHHKQPVEQLNSLISPVKLHDLTQGCVLLFVIFMIRSSSPLFYFAFWIDTLESFTNSKTQREIHTGGSSVLPSQDFRSALILYPLAHAHSNEPAVFRQVPRHPPLSSRHSLKSVEKGCIPPQKVQRHTIACLTDEQWVFSC